MEKEEIVIYTDGACSGNPGPGGWAAVLQWKASLREISGFEPDTTNNRMELRAVIEALKSLRRKNLPIRIFTDSQYIHKAFSDRWLVNWQKNGWKTKGGTPVKNKDLWEELVALTGGLSVSWNWVRGHADNPYNNRCDELARQEIQESYSKRLGKGVST
jgi:ribonuclease HI